VRVCPLGETARETMAGCDEEEDEVAVARRRGRVRGAGRGTASSTTTCGSAGKDDDAVHTLRGGNRVRIRRWRPGPIPMARTTAQAMGTTTAWAMVTTTEIEGPGVEWQRVCDRTML
jgi:hypothetical protein